jgi:hypothetical protein
VTTVVTEEGAAQVPCHITIGDTWSKCESSTLSRPKWHGHMRVSLSFKKVVAFLSVIYYNPLVKNITLNDIFYNPLLIIYTPLEKPAAPLPAFLRLPASFPQSHTASAPGTGAVVFHTLF